MISNPMNEYSNVRSISDAKRKEYDETPENEVRRSFEAPFGRGKSPSGSPVHTILEESDDLHESSIQYRHNSIGPDIKSIVDSSSTVNMVFSQLHLQSISELSSNISYSNSTEYRRIFRKITHQSEHPPENPLGIDDETLDEQHYDDDTVSRFMDTVYHSTQHSSLLQHLYDSAAAKMISTNREIGLAVLFSYDYMSAFYTCYCEYISSPETFSETTQSYMKIKSLLG